MGSDPVDLVNLNPRFFRPGSSGHTLCVNYVIGDGGIGDYICYMSAIKWVADNHPQVEGRVYCGDFFVELAENILQSHHPRWKVYERSALTQAKIAKRPTYGPMFRPINCTGAHPVDLGFIYYANMTPPPADGNFYPQLNLPEMEIPSQPYAVMTPGAAMPNRTMAPSAFNGIKDHLISLGITPMFLGKKDITKVRKISFHEEYNYEGGVDLREKTTLLQAAALMSKAKVVVGLDNGLLHLAGCTEVPIVFGYNIASPEHRQPRRKKGLIRQIYPDPKQLTCTFCQSQMRFMFNHDFSNCVYKDNLCLEAMSDPKDWCGLIDEILAENDANNLQSGG